MIVDKIINVTQEPITFRGGFKIKLLYIKKDLNSLTYEIYFFNCLGACVDILDHMGAPI